MNGRVLDFSIAADQVAGVSWYVSTVVSAVDAMGLKRARLTGFYWLNEGVDDLDHGMIRNVANHIHAVQPPQPPQPPANAAAAHSSEGASTGKRMSKGEGEGESGSTSGGQRRLFLMWIPSFRASFKVDYGCV